MKIPNDIINIVRRLLLRQKSKGCNREYNDSYHEYTSRGRLVGLIYKYKGFMINHRFYDNKYIRTEIICFLTDIETGYYVPKNY